MEFNSSLLVELRTARSHGWPLSVARGERSRSARVAERDWMLACALTLYEASLCPGCGQPRHESMDPANEHRYHADLPLRCHACTAQVRRVKEYADQTDREALYYDVKLRP